MIPLLWLWLPWCWIMNKLNILHRVGYDENEIGMNEWIKAGELTCSAVAYKKYLVG